MSEDRKTLLNVINEDPALQEALNKANENLYGASCIIDTHMRSSFPKNQNLFDDLMSALYVAFSLAEKTGLRCADAVYLFATELEARVNQAEVQSDEDQNSNSNEHVES